MNLKLRKNVMNYSDDRVLNYGVVFLICALVSTLGGGALALVCFALLALIVEVLSHWLDQPAGKLHQQS
jgi:hypothetical protein